MNPAEYIQKLFFEETYGANVAYKNVKKPSANLHLAKSLAVIALVSIVSLASLRAIFDINKYGKSGLTHFGSEVTGEVAKFEYKVGEQYGAVTSAVSGGLSSFGHSVSSTVAAIHLPRLERAAKKPAQSQPTVATSSPPPVTGTPTQSAQTESITTAPFAAAADRPDGLPADNSPSAPGPSDTPQYANGHYAYGQCTYYAASRRPIPPNWGNARDWLWHAQALGYHTGDIPVAGAIAWSPNGRYGHVAYVEQVVGDQALVAEMNYSGWNRVSRRWVNSASFKYIY